MYKNINYIELYLRVSESIKEGTSQFTSHLYKHPFSIVNCLSFFKNWQNALFIVYRHVKLTSIQVSSLSFDN